MLLISLRVKYVCAFPRGFRSFLTQLVMKANRPAGASVPPLGLSNKAVGDGRDIFPSHHQRTYGVQSLLSLLFLPLLQGAPSKVNSQGLHFGQKLRKSMGTDMRLVPPFQIRA